MIYFEETINVIKQFNSSYVYPMDYTIFDTHDTDPNDQKDYGRIINIKFLRDESVSAVLTMYCYLNGSSTPQQATVSDTSCDMTFFYNASVKRIRLVYHGLIAENIGKIVELNCSFGELLSDRPIGEDVVFVPYMSNITKCRVVKTGYGTEQVQQANLEYVNVSVVITNNSEQTNTYQKKVYSNERYAVIVNPTDNKIIGEINLYTLGFLTGFPTGIPIEVPLVRRLDNYFHLHNNSNS